MNKTDKQRMDWLSSMSLPTCISIGRGGVWHILSDLDDDMSVTTENKNLRKALDEAISLSEKIHRKMKGKRTSAHG